MSDKDLIKVTISITKEDRKLLKQLALDRDTTVSALIRTWIDEAYNKGGTNEARAS